MKKITFALLLLTLSSNSFATTKSEIKNRFIKENPDKHFVTLERYRGFTWAGIVRLFTYGESCAKITFTVTKQENTRMTKKFYYCTSTPKTGS